MSTPTRRYRGFISYSQKDKAFARRLHRALEQYTLPGGKKLGRFFRDDDELGGEASLGTALEKSIRSSEDLIVIASPHSAGSKWVNQEVIHFKKQADAEKQVFAVVIAGTPNAGDAEEAFVPALKSRVAPDGSLTGEPDQPLAPDARKEPFKRLVTKLVAGLEGIPFDDLWQRQKRRARRRAFATVTLLIAMSAPLVWWGVTTTLQLRSSETQLESLDTATQQANFRSTYHERVLEQLRADWGADVEFPPEDIEILLATDLDGDAYQDYFVRLQNINFCGSGGCLHEIVLSANGTYRTIHGSAGGDLQVLPGTQNGVRDVALGFGETLDGDSVYQVLQFDGQEYQIRSYVLCSGAVTYCGLSTALSDEPFGDTMEIVFDALEEEALQVSVATNAVYEGIQPARLEDQSALAGNMIDYVAGIDASGEFALVHIWKGTYGVARLSP